MGGPRRRWSRWALSVPVLVVALGACSGGGADNRDLTGGGSAGASTTQIQFMGADKVKLSGTTAGLYSSTIDSSSLNWPTFDSFTVS